MKLKARFTVRDLNMIGYIHSVGLDEAFGGQVENAMDYAVKISMTQAKRFGRVDAIIPIVWGDGDEPVVDIFGIGKDYDAWPGNPSVKNWIFANEIYSRTCEISCTEGMRIVGKELDWRAETDSLDHFLRVRPDQDRDFVRKRHDVLELDTGVHRIYSKPEAPRKARPVEKLVLEP